MAWRDFVNSLGGGVEAEQADIAYKKAAVAKAMQDIFDNQRKNTPVFSMGDLSGVPRETPTKTDQDLQSLFTGEYGSPEARLAAIDAGLKKKTGQLSYEQKPVFTSSEFEKATEGIKQLREQQKQVKKGVHRIIDKKTGKVLQEFPGSEGSGDTITTVGEGNDTGENSLLRIAANNLEKLQGEARSGATAIKGIDQALDLVDKGVTGIGGKAKAYMAPIAELFGVNTQGMDDAATYEALTRAIAGPMRMDIVGAGPVSDWEQKLISQMSGGGGQAKEAAKTLLNRYRTMAAARISNYNQSAKNAYSLHPQMTQLFPSMEEIGDRIIKKPEQEVKVLTATNPSNNAKIQSLDGGKTWNLVPPQ